MSYRVVASSKFKSDYKKSKKRGFDIEALKQVANLLSEGTVLPYNYKDHQLIGQKYECRECHIKPDWLLIYYIDESDNTLNLIATGTHSDLF